MLMTTWKFRKSFLCNHLPSVAEFSMMTHTKQSDLKAEANSTYTKLKKTGDKT